MTSNVPTLAEQISVVGREIGMRKAYYPRAIRTGKLTKEAADRQLAHLEAAYITLKSLLQP